MTRHAPDSVKLRILEATVDSLVDGGYAATTTLAVQRRAGLSRGTLQHHYATRPQLMAATVEHIGARRYDELLESLEALEDSGQSLRAAAIALRRSFSTATFQAEVELWIAARTDEQLRSAIVPVERKLGRQMLSGLAVSFGAVPESVRAEVVRVAVDVMRGRCITDALRAKPLSRSAAIERDLSSLLTVIEGHIANNKKEGSDESPRQYERAIC